MIIVMEMSTDLDICNTTLDQAWGPIPSNNRHKWAQVQEMNLNIVGNATIVVVAHGNDTQIGNAHSGTVDINAETFLALVHGNVNPAPAAIYISTCGSGIAQFAANVRIAARDNRIWNNTRILGHSDPVDLSEI
jgi:hypothetical protein